MLSLPVCVAPGVSLGFTCGGFEHLWPVGILTYSPSCAGLREAPPSPPPPYTPWAEPTFQPAAAPSLGKGLRLWETQARAFSSAWFSREPWLEGDGRRSPKGRGSPGSRTGTGRGRVWVGPDPAASYFASSANPLPKGGRVHWRQGLGLAGFPGVGGWGGKPRTLCL